MPHHSNALVSVGVPVYNGAAYLALALESLLAQTHRALEIVICDNGSTDETPEIAREFAARDARVSYHRFEQNVGAARNFNRTLEHANGEYFRWFGHDDVLDPSYVERCLSELEAASPDHVVCYTDVDYMDEEGQALPERAQLSVDPRDLSFARYVRLEATFCPVLVFGLVRTEALRKTRGIGGFIMSDLITVAELRMLGPFVRVQAPLFHQRVYPRTERMRRNTLEGEAVWFDPKNANKRLYPNVRIMGEYLRSIWNIAPLWKRPFYALAASTYLPICCLRQTRHTVWATWSRVLASAMAPERRGSVALRAWTLLAGLRKRDGALLAAALGGPYGKTPAAAAQYCAKRLLSRNKPGTDALLLSWLTSHCAQKRAAAAAVIAPLAQRFERELEAQAAGDEPDSALAAALKAAIHDQVPGVLPAGDVEGQRAVSRS